jgi:hypothetical protein
MYSFVRNITLKLFSFALIAVMGLCVANKVIFTHSHILENGTVYTHAHPYNKTNDSKPFKSHPHTSAEFLFFETLDIQFIFHCFIAISPIIFKRIQFHHYLREKYFHFSLNPDSGRAPPR